MPRQLAMMFPQSHKGRVVEVLYTNHRGETRVRRYRPIMLYWGEVLWHNGPQWLMEGFDIDKQEIRTFALKDMRPVPEGYQS